MNIKNKLILFKKQYENEFKDITEKIRSLIINKKSYKLYFNSGKIYPAKFDNVMILEKQGCVNLANYTILYKGKIKSDITKVDVYVDICDKKFYKVFCVNGYSFICKSKDIEFYKFLEDDKNLINYWKSCACETDIDTISNMMCLQYDNLVVNPNSVLYFYINKLNNENKLEDNIICPFDFNYSQLKAVRSALSNKISIIKGPPGTGKTQTILNLVCNLIIRGKSIAIISSNNTAIESIEKKLRENGYEVIFASLGNGDRKSEFFSNKTATFQTTNLENIDISLKKLPDLEKLFDRENKSKSLNEEIEAIKLEKLYYEKLNHENLINVDQYKFRNSQSLIKYVTRYQDDTKEKKFTFFLWLKLIIKYGFKKALIKAKNREQILTSLEYKYYTLKLVEMSKELEELKEPLKDKEQLVLEYKTLSKKLLSDYISKNINFNLKFTQKDYKKRFSQFIRRYPIIISTAISFMSSIESEYIFDYVIIDEASQVTIPSTIPLLNKCKNLVIVGDDKQLPPIEKYKTICNFDNVFDSNKESLITSFMKIYPDVVTTLLEHYRCDPTIIGFCNLKYYNNQLIPFTTNREKQSLDIFFTSNENHMRRINHGMQNGIYNQREIDVIDEILNENKYRNLDHNEIGIISPYRLQADKLQRKYPDIECDTIHKFQGREKNVIIFSSVLDNKASTSEITFVDNPNMLNVTVSRAKEKFILVTNEKAFESKGKEIHDLINYISYKSMNENLFKSKCISIFDYLYKSKEIERNKILVNCSSKSNHYSEKLLRVLLDKLIMFEEYKQFTIQEQVKVKDIIRNLEIFDEDELTYIKNNCSVDFLIKDKVNQDIVCIIEVDGVEFHENNKEQQIKDELKDSILNKCNISLLRLKTNGSNEENKIKQIFNNYLNKFRF